jgi:hypothetical protein
MNVLQVAVVYAATMQGYGIWDTAATYTCLTSAVGDCSSADVALCRTW